jgi:2'-5' RNA ligase
MSNYLKIEVPIRQSAKWFVNLRKAMAEAKIPVKWQPGGFHLTVAFISNDQPTKALSIAFDRQMSGREAPLQTFDKVNAFIAKTSSEIIIHLTSTQLSPTMQTLVDSLRKEAIDAGADIENDFILHVTLGRINAKKAALEQVRRIVESIQVPPFTLLLQKAEYRYFRGKSIQRWTMNQNN